MGLDMYLSKKIYVGANYEHRNVTGTVDIKVGEKTLPVNLKRISYIEEQVGYWRKANHIHQWFVDNVQEGEDNCQEAYVSEEKLQELLDTCKKVKADHSLAEELLPTKSGFFFGGTEYDEYYFQRLDHTIGILESLLQEKEEGAEYLNGDIYYNASW
jgi:hypothetical protein